MKKYILAILVLCTTVLNGNLFAQINFDKFDWEKLTEKAKANDQLIMVDMTATWCHWCKVMDQKVFSTAQAGKFYNANFISTKLYDTHPMGKKFNNKYKVSGYPTMLFLDHTGKLVHTIGGALTDIDAFIMEGKSALAAAQKKVINNGGNEDDVVVIDDNNEEKEMTLDEKCDWLYDLAMDKAANFETEYNKFAKSSGAKKEQGLQLTLDLVAEGLTGAPLAEFNKLEEAIVNKFGAEEIENAKFDAIESRVAHAMAATKNLKDIEALYNKNTAIVKDYYYDDKTNFLGLAATVGSYDDIKEYLLAAKAISIYATKVIPSTFSQNDKEELIAAMLDSILSYKKEVDNKEALYKIAEEFAQKAEKKYPSAMLYGVMSDMYATMGQSKKAEQYAEMAE